MVFFNVNIDLEMAFKKNINPTRKWDHFWIFLSFTGDYSLIYKLIGQDPANNIVADHT